MNGAQVRGLSVAVVAAAALVIGAVATFDRVAGPSMGASVVSVERVTSGALAMRVVPLPGVAGPLRENDIVEAIDGRPISAWSSLGSSRPRIGTTVRVHLERGGGPLDIDVPLTGFPTLPTLGANWGTLAFCLVFALVAALVFWRRPGDPAAGALLLASTGTIGSSVPFLLGMQPLDLVSGSAVLSWGATLVVYLLLWVGLAHFVLVFPRPLPFLRERPWLEAGLYLGAFGGYALVGIVALAVTAGLLDWFAFVNAFQYIVILASLVLASMGAVAQWRQASAADRRTLRAVVAAMGFTAIASIVVWLVPEILTGRPLIPWTIEGLVGLPVPIAIAAAVLRHRAFDIDVVVRRTVVYGGLTAAVLVTYAATVAVLGRFLAGDETFAVSLLSTGAAALVALPVRDLLQRAVDRFLFGDRREPVRAIRRLGRRLEATAEGESIPQVVVDTVADALRVPYVALELGTDSGVRARPEAASIEPGTAVPGRPTAVRGEPHGELISVPVSSGGRPLGRLIVSARQAGEALSADDHRLLDDLARQVGAVIHAGLLAEDLQRSRERIVAAREEERRRLRRDLHDGLGPSLAAIGMRADASLALIAKDSVAAERSLIELAADVRAAVLEIRRIVDGLRPPALDELGLAGALQREAERLEATGERTRFCLEASDPPIELPAAAEVAAYRIATEAMTNVVRHANAGHCTVRLSTDDALTVEVVDDGIGLPAERRIGVGLLSMRERAAELGGDCVVEARVGGGTVVRATLPLWRDPAVGADP